MLYPGGLGFAKTFEQKRGNGLAKKNLFGRCVSLTAKKLAAAKAAVAGDASLAARCKADLARSGSAYSNVGPMRVGPGAAGQAVGVPRGGANPTVGGGGSAITGGRLGALPFLFASRIRQGRVLRLIPGLRRASRGARLRSQTPRCRGLAPTGTTARSSGVTRGRAKVRIVGPPGALSSSNVPPSMRTRSPMPTMPEPATLRCARERPSDLEAVPVVAHAHLDRRPTHPDADVDVRRPGVLADVGERFLDRAVDRDPLGRRDRLRIAADLEFRRDPGALGERIGLAVEDLAERARDDAPRLERARELAQVAVELRHAGEHVVEAPCGALAVALEDEGVDLVAQERHLGAEREDVLDGAVVQVEADPHQPLLAGADESLLALRRALEQELALEDRGERRAGRREVGVGASDRLDHAGDDRSARRAEAADEARTKRLRAEQAQRRAPTQRCLRGRAGATAARSVPERQHHVDVASVGPPERRLGRDAELEQEPQLDLAGDERRQLEQDRARADVAMEVEARGVQRLAPHLGERLDGDLHVGRVELALGGEGHDDACDVGADGEPVGGIRLARALERDEGPAVRGAEEEVHPRLGLGEQHPMRRLEPKRRRSGQR